MRFREAYPTIPFISIGARADYQVTERASLFLAGNFDKFFRKPGDTTIYDIETREKEFELGGAGMDFYALTISAGLKLTF